MGEENALENLSPGYFVANLEGHIRRPFEGKEEKGMRFKFQSLDTPFEWIKVAVKVYLLCP